MDKIIQVKKVLKKYAQNKVLEDLSFEINEGSFTTLIGCNGAGKSTTLKLIAGNESIDSGQIKVLNEDPFSFDFSRRSDVFFIHENIDMVFPVNLLEMLSYYRNVFPNWSNAIFNSLLKERKFSIKKNFSDLSRGQKVQFLLMMALASRPKILLLDEITSVIDIDGQRFFLEKIKDFTREGGTVVVTTNILSEMDSYTDQLILLQDSRLLVDAMTSEIKSKFFIFSKTENHPIFLHPEIAKIKKSETGVEWYIAPRRLIDEDTTLMRFKVNESPKLEDILILHFKMKQGSFDEELVA